MPFPDEITPDALRVVPYRSEWETGFATLAATLAKVLGPLALAIDHVGSTSVPGMAAKDCIDVQVRVADVTSPEIESRMTAAGFRRRPEAWNTTEESFGVTLPKQVYAPAIGDRRVNIHIRLAGGEGARYALLFRDYLRAHPAIRDRWSAFKLQLSSAVSDISAYGQVKQPATDILMAGAQIWAALSDWEAGTG